MRAHIAVGRELLAAVTAEYHSAAFSGSLGSLVLSRGLRSSRLLERSLILLYGSLRRNRTLEITLHIADMIGHILEGVTLRAIADRINTGRLTAQLAVDLSHILADGDHQHAGLIKQANQNIAQNHDAKASQEVPTKVEKSHKNVKEAKNRQKNCQ